jgi:protein-S-isoprenylcysteine O-methyltransferase
VLLCNPISTMLFARISWQFFHDRIPYEELHLERFFGKDYVDYRQRVPTRIPFIP